jgi:hypothetical protein
MPASIQASPASPILFTVGEREANAAKPTTITWNTGSLLLRGEVHHKINGVDKGRFDDGAASSASKVFSVKYGDTAEFTLKQELWGTVLAPTLLVSTSLDLVLPDNWPQLLRQEIMMLRAAPVADFVYLRWRTRRAAGCWVEMQSAGGQLRWGWTPEGLLHEVRFDRLAQDTDYTYRIFTGNAKHSGTVRTGTRNAIVHFDTLHVWRAGDANSAGELHFSYAAGDAETRGYGTTFRTGWNDIDSGRALGLYKDVTISAVSRYVWIDVHGIEDDSFFGPPFTASGDTPYSEPGVSGDHSPSVSSPRVSVCDHVDLHPDLGPISAGVGGVAVPEAVVPFQLRTGPMAIGYDVHGSIRVQVTRGAWTSGFGRLIYSRKLPDLSKSIKKSGVLSTGKALVSFDLGPDGMAYIRSEPDGRRPREALLGGPFRDGIIATVVGDRIQVLGICEGDGLVGALFDPCGDLEVSWQGLGLPRVQSVAAAPAPGGVDVLAVTAGREIAYRRLCADHERTEWESLGDGVGSIAVRNTDHGLTVITAAAGNYRHRRRTVEGSWDKWIDLGQIPSSTFAIDWKSRSATFEITAVDDDEVIRVLCWPEYPVSDSRPDWVVIGELADLRYAPSTYSS